jgi:hypothetical protein
LISRGGLISSLESKIACRNEPGPLSFTFVTVKVDANAGSKLAQTANNPHSVIAFKRFIRMLLITITFFLDKYRL